MKNNNPKIMIDTCIFKNMLGFDDEQQNIKISAAYEKEKLKNFIRHNSCAISVFSLLEIVRDKKIKNPEIVNSIQNFNFKIYTPFAPEDDIYSDFKKEISSPEKSAQFILRTTEKIIEFAKQIYARISLIPCIFFCKMLEEICVASHVPFPEKQCNQMLEKSTLFLENVLQEQLSKDDGFKKNCMRVINQVYLHLLKDTICWNNEVLNDVVDNLKPEALESAIENFYERIIENDFSTEMRFDTESNKNCVYIDHNIEFFAISLNTLKDLAKKQKIEIEEAEILKNEIDKAIKVLFVSDGKSVIDHYIQKICDDLYKTYLDDSKAKNYRALIDTNSIIDCLGLDFAYRNGYVFLSTDKEIVRQAMKVYDEQSKEVIRDFIKYGREVIS